MTDRLLRCNKANICKDISCPHYAPHEEYPVYTKGHHPQCRDKDTFCYAENKKVNCIPINTPSQDTLKRWGEEANGDNEAKL